MAGPLICPIQDTDSISIMLAKFEMDLMFRAMFSPNPWFSGTRKVNMSTKLRYKETHALNTIGTAVLERACDALVKASGCKDIQQLMDSCADFERYLKIVLDDAGLELVSPAPLLHIGDLVRPRKDQGSWLTEHAWPATYFEKGPNAYRWLRFSGGSKTQWDFDSMPKMVRVNNGDGSGVEVTL